MKSYIEKTKNIAQAFYLPTVLLLESRLAFLNGNYKEALKILEHESFTENYTSKIELLELKEKSYFKLNNFQKAYQAKKELSDFKEIDVNFIIEERKELFLFF